MVCEFCDFVDNFQFTCPGCLATFDSKQSVADHAIEEHGDKMGFAEDCETCPDNIRTKNKRPKVDVDEEDQDNTDAEGLAYSLFGMVKAVEDTRWVKCKEFMNKIDFHSRTQ